MPVTAQFQDLLPAWHRRLNLFLLLLQYRALDTTLQILFSVTSLRTRYELPHRHGLEAFHKRWVMPRMAESDSRCATEMVATLTRFRRTVRLSRTEPSIARHITWLWKAVGGYVIRSSDQTQRAWKVGETMRAHEHIHRSTISNSARIVLLPLEKAARGLLFRRSGRDLKSFAEISISRA